MLQWRRIADNFISISVGKEYDDAPYYWTTFYYYRGLLIDTGCPHTVEEAARFVEDMRLNIKAILLTHYHEDHSGGAYLFKEKFGAEVFAPQKSLEKLLNPPKIPAYREIVWGQPEPVKAYPLHEDMEFEDAKIKTIETPGHSFDHVSFLIKDIAFIGDLVANPNPIIIMREEDYIDLINSLKNFTDLGFEVAYGGHGVWSKSDLINALNNILKLKEKVEDFWKKGLNVDQIVERIFPKTPSKVLLMEEMSEGEWSRRNLVESLLGMHHF
jgi:glyoxylase-like metal-dependent hydrolase (beta-lactamase superfamily II)